MPQTIQRGCADHDGNPQENCRYCKDLDRRLEAARDGEECSPCSAWVECVAKCAERTADRFGVLHGQCSGTEQTIYGEIERAFNEFAEQLRTKGETHSTDRAQRQSPAPPTP